MNGKSCGKFRAVGAAILSVAALVGARAAAQSCGGYNLYTLSEGPLPGITDIGLHTDDGIAVVILPFIVSAYGQSFGTAVVSTNGQLTLGTTGTTAYSNVCLPAPAFTGVTLAPFWDDLRTDGPGQGVFTATYGTAPNRVFVIEWRAGYYSGFTGNADFAVIFRESDRTIKFEYLVVSDGSGGAQSEGASSTVGIQNGQTGRWSQFSCNAGVVTSGLVIQLVCAVYQLPYCAMDVSQPSGAAGTSFVVRCYPTPGNGPISTGFVASVDATGIGGGTVALHDDGVAPDVQAGDAIFSGTVTSAPGTPPASYTLTSTVTDAQGRSSTCTETYSVVQPPPCAGYNISVSQVTQLVPTSIDVGNHGDDVLTTITLPFSVGVYGQTFTQATVCSNGSMTMGATGGSAYANTCLPTDYFPDVALAPFWDDLRTDGAGHGIFTATYGSAPNRAFVIEWRVGYFSFYSGTADFEVILYENQTYFDYLYGAVNDGAGSAQSEGAGSTIGAQRSVSGPAAQFGCNAGGLINGEWLRFSCAPYVPLSCSLSTSPTGGQPGTAFAAYCSVAPGNGPISTGLAVSLDAGAIGGGTVALHDDGVAPDQAANDHVFSGTVMSAAGTPSGSYTLTSAVSDAQGRSSNCAVGYAIIVPPPPNDDCANAMPASLGDNFFDNRTATDWPGQFCNRAPVSKDLWYTITTPSAGALTVMTCLGGGTYSTDISVYTDCTGCNLVGTGVGGCGIRSSITFCAAANQTYLLRIGGSSPSGWVGTFNISFTAAPYTPPADAIPEGEACGITPDMFNGGCYAPSHHFSEAALCRSYRGTASNVYELYHDADWYHFTMPGAGSLRIIGQTDFPAQCSVLGFSCQPPLVSYGVALPSGGTCGAATIDLTIPLSGPGEYAVGIEPRSYQFDVPCGVAGNYWFNLHSNTFTCPDPACCRNDYNGDGDVGTDADIEAFFACLAGSCCPACPPNADFNCDGDAGTDADIETFFRVLAGGPC